MAKLIYIYRIFFPTNGKCYIGQTIYLDRRMNEHIKSSKSLVGRALQKHDEWEVSLLHTCKTRDEANRIEIEEIRNHNSIKPNGYNITAGGGGGKDGYAHTKETKEKLSNARTGRKHTEETKAKMMGNQYAKGHYWFATEETKAKMRIAHTGEKNVMFGKHHTEESKKKISKNHADVKGENNPNFGKKTSTMTKFKRLKTYIAKLNITDEELKLLELLKVEDRT